MVSTIRDHIIEGTRGKRSISRDYELFVNGDVHQLRLNTPYNYHEDKSGLLILRSLPTSFASKSCLNQIMLKIQVEVKARDKQKRVSAVDHVFEAIMIISDNAMNWKGVPQFTEINGIQVKRKQELFHSNMAPLVNRVASITKVGPTTLFGKLFAGKCAQDVLRIVYILLDGLQEDKPRWVETKSTTSILNVEDGKDICDAMMKELGRLGTPIEIFTFISSYIEPCVTASRSRYMDVFENDEDIKRTGTIGRDFGDIIDAFKSSFAGGEDLLKRKSKTGAHDGGQTHRTDRAGQKGWGQDCLDEPFGQEKKGV